MLNSKGLKQSPCKTPIPTISASLIYADGNNNQLLIILLHLKCGGALILLAIICGLPLQMHLLDPIVR